MEIGGNGEGLYTVDGMENGMRMEIRGEVGNKDGEGL